MSGTKSVLSKCLLNEQVNICDLVKLTPLLLPARLGMIPLHRCGRG